MNVLILTDFSKVAENSGRYAVHLLQGVPANFYLLNIETFNYRNEAVEHVRERKALAIEKLNAKQEQLQKETNNPAHNFQIAYSEDNLVNAARRFVAEKKIDLLVMGASGEETVQNAILGNHTYEIIRKVKCNLLAVPEGSCYKKQPENIILPIDYSASLNDDIFKFFEIPGIVSKTNLMVMEIHEPNSGHASVELPRQEVFGHLNSTRNVQFREMEESEIFTKRLLLQVQRSFDMIVILGKNLSICDRLLHNKYGMCTEVCNTVPILVLH